MLIARFSMHLFLKKTKYFFYLETFTRMYCKYIINYFCLFHSSQNVMKLSVLFNLIIKCISNVYFKKYHVDHYNKIQYLDYISKVDNLIGQINKNCIYFANI